MLQNDLTLYALPFKALGSVCELKLYLPSQHIATEILSSVVSVVDSYQKKYSRYVTNSLVSRINLKAGTGHFTQVDEETDHLLNYADVLFEQSDGLFDITSGVLRKAWNFKADTLPLKSDLSSLVHVIGWQHVERQERSIYLPVEGMEIDFGGYVKEYIADVVANHCVALGVRHGLVNLGGDIHVIGPHVDGKPWVVGIAHPRQQNQAITSVLVNKGAVATSGDYERYMLVDGIRYCHILNPKTGMSIRPKYASVTVIADSCLIAGSFSTAAMLKSEYDDQWIKESSLPYLLVDQSMNVTQFLD